MKQAKRWIAVVGVAALCLVFAAMTPAAGALTVRAQASTTGAPGAPTGLKVTSSDGVFDLSWTAPTSTGGSKIVGYNVYAAPVSGEETYCDAQNGTYDGNALVTTTSTSISAYYDLSLGCEIEDFTGGDTYYFQVTAVNAGGTESTYSSEVSAVYDDTPGAPTAVTATAAYEGANVSWTAPTNDGGFGISSYTVTAADSTNAGRGGQTCTVTGTPPATTCLVTGLTDGDSYTFTVTATNSASPTPAVSLASSPSNAITPGLSVPQPLSSVAAVAGNNDVTISWSAPTNGTTASGGSDITGYNIYEGTTSGGENYSTPLNGVVLYTGTSITVTGLTDGTTYYFTVKAVNAQGSSAPSNEVTGVPVDDSPSAPTDLTAVGGYQSAELSWTAPTSDGISPLEGYEIYAGAESAGTCTPVDTGNFVDAPATSYDLTGLTAATGTEYCFAVYAYNTDGYFAESNEATADTADTVPGAPTALEATTPSGTEVDLSWTAPSDTGNGTISQYNIYSGTPGSGTFVNSVSGATTTDDITSLSPDTSYSYYVVAENTVGFSSDSNGVTITTGVDTPGTPTDLAVAGNGVANEVDVTWTAPADEGGSSITTYDLWYSTTSGAEATGTEVVETASAVCTGLSCSATVGLPADSDGTTFYFVVEATNSGGDTSAASTQASGVPSTTPDGPATATASVSGLTSVTVSWTAPTNDGGSPVTSYEVGSYNETTGEYGPTCTTTASVLTCNVTGLTENDEYEFWVYAFNVNGEGGYTYAYNSSDTYPNDGYDFYPGPVAPGAPTGVSVSTVTDTDIYDVSWTAPTNDGGAAVQYYEVYWGCFADEVDGGTTGPLITTTGTSAVLDLTDTDIYECQILLGRTYFAVYAVNSIGASASSVEALAVEAPAAPSTVSASVVSAGKILVAWGTPANGGSAITGYIVTPYKNGVAQTAKHYGTATSENITGLSPGSYYFTVEAVNSAGTGPASGPSNIVSVGKVASKTTLTVSKSKVTYGKENVERLSVSVTGAYGSGTGHVTISGTTCHITLSGGHGSCKLSKKALKVGTHHLRATYSGNTDYLGSTSAAKSVKVVS